MLDSDDAIREAMDMKRGVADIGLLDSDIEFTSDDAMQMYEQHQEEAREDDSLATYESYEDFIKGEGIEVYNGPEAESEWARLACSVAEVRVLVDEVAEREFSRFECEDEYNSCTLHGDHDTSTVMIAFEGSKLIAFTRADVAGRTDEGTDKIYEQISEVRKKLATLSCARAESKPGSSLTSPKELESREATPAEAVAESAEPRAPVSPAALERAAEALREAVRKRGFKGTVDHLVAPEQKIKLSFGIVEGSHGDADFIENESRFVVGARAFNRTMRRLQSGDMPVILIGKKLRCYSDRGTHRCNFGIEGFGYDPNLGPQERSVFAVEFGATTTGVLFIREIQIRTDT